MSILCRPLVGDMPTMLPAGTSISRVSSRGPHATAMQHAAPSRAMLSRHVRPARCGKDLGSMTTAPWPLYGAHYILYLQPVYPMSVFAAVLPRTWDQGGRLLLAARDFSLHRCAKMLATTSTSPACTDLPGLYPSRRRAVADETKPPLCRVAKAIWIGRSRG